MGTASGMEGGYRSAEQHTPACVAFVCALSGASDQSGDDAGLGGGGAEDAGFARRRRAGVGMGVEDRVLGAAGRWGPCASDFEQAADADRGYESALD